MRTGYARLSAIGMLLLLAVGLGAAQGDNPPTQSAAGPTAAPDASDSTKTPAGKTPAVVITLRGVVDEYNRDALFKRFDAARKLGARVVILKLDTPGGLVTAGLDISRFLKRQDDLHVVAFVHEKAYSAGIMIGLACDELVMQPGSYVGDSAPIALDSGGGLQKLEGAERAKIESPILADFHDSAVRNGHDPLLAEAMVSYARVVRWVERADAPAAAPATAPGGEDGSSAVESENVEPLDEDPRPNPFLSALPQPRPPAGAGELAAAAQPRERRFVNAEEFAKLTQDGWREVAEPGVPRPIDGPDTLLTVSASVAHKIGLAKAIAASPEALAAERGYTIVGDLTPGAGERFVSILGSTGARFILLTVFLLSLWVALHTPGAGAAEALAMISLGLLVGVPLLTGYAQWWEIALIGLGLILIALELFVIPGFGIAGVSGIALLLGGLVMTFVGNVPGVAGMWRLPQVWAGVQNGLLVVVVAFAASGVLAVWLRRYLPKLPYLNRLVLQTPAGAMAGPHLPGAAAAAAGAADAWPFVGTIGRAVSDLRPGGSAEFPYADDRRTAPVVSDSGFVPAGTRLAVREVRGNRVVVRPLG
jgi:membrane-bound serine protease (ClpP class)